MSEDSRQASDWTRLHTWADADSFLLRGEPKAPFLRLFEQQLHRVAADPSRPKATEVIVARRAAALWWQLNRVTSNGSALQSAVYDELSRLQARAELAAELGMQCKLTDLVANELRAMDDLLELDRYDDTPTIRLVEEA